MNNFVEDPLLIISGHKVDIIGAMRIQVTINVPWKHSNQTTVEQKDYVFKRLDKIVTYLVKEDFIGGDGLDIDVLTSHPAK